MKILVVGGGSGGHITPAVAVVREILRARPRAHIEFWTDFKYFKNVTKLTTELKLPWVDSADLAPNLGSHHSSTKTSSAKIRVRRLPAGKFHRYAGWTFTTYFKHFGITLRDIVLGNLLGLCGFLAGLIVSFARLLPSKTRPDVIFLKGGFVGLPVGLTARLFKIPYIIHESDAVPGLANRLLMKHAHTVAYGMPPTDDQRPGHVWTGIPVGPEFAPVTPSRQKSLKKVFSFSPDKPLVVITGGSQGSENLNEATRAILPDLLKFTSVALVAGRKYYENYIDLKRYETWDKASLESNFRMWEFSTTMNELLGAADVVVSRAGATTIAELSALKKPVILVPFEFLPGSHQVRNAEHLSSTGSALVLNDADMMQAPTKLLEMIRHLVRSPKECADLSAKLHEATKSDAAANLADIIIKAATREGK